MGIIFCTILTSIRRNNEIKHLGERWKFSLYGTLFNITEYSVKGNSSGTSACWVYFFANLIAHQTLTSFQNPLWCSSVGPINIREGKRKKEKKRNNNTKKTRQHQGVRGAGDGHGASDDYTIRLYNKLIANCLLPTFLTLSIDHVHAFKEIGGEDSLGEAPSRSVCRSHSEESTALPQPA